MRHTAYAFIPLCFCFCFSSSWNICNFYSVSVKMTVSSTPDSEWTPLAIQSLSSETVPTPAPGPTQRAHSGSLWAASVCAPVFICSGFQCVPAALLLLKCHLKLCKEGDGHSLLGSISTSFKLNLNNFSTAIFFLVFITPMSITLFWYFVKRPCNCKLTFSF